MRIFTKNAFRLHSCLYHSFPPLHSIYTLIDVYIYPHNLYRWSYLVDSIILYNFFLITPYFSTDNVKFIPMNDTKLGSYSIKTKKAIAWLQAYGDKTGCKMPDTNTTNLPSCLTKGSYQIEIKQLHGIRLFTPSYSNNSLF